MTEQAIINGAEIMDALTLADSLRSEGSFEEARAYIAGQLPGLTGDARLAMLQMAARVERAAGKAAASLRILFEAAPLAEVTRDPERKAKYHHDLAVTYQMLGEIEQALGEYRSSAYHWHDALRPFDAACTENNVALILAGEGRYAEAREHIKEARKGLVGWPVKTAEVDETEAQIFLAEGEPEEAERLVLGAMCVFHDHGERELLKRARYTLIKAAADCQAVSR